MKTTTSTQFKLPDADLLKQEIADAAEAKRLKKETLHQRNLRRQQAEMVREITSMQEQIDDNWESLKNRGCVTLRRSTKARHYTDPDYVPSNKIFWKAVEESLPNGYTLHPNPSNNNCATLALKLDEPALANKSNWLLGVLSIVLGFLTGAGLLKVIF